MTIPKHVVIIPDGNRRWARRRGRLGFMGHEAGMRTMEKIIRRAAKEDIPYLTVWGTSRGNVTKRSRIELRALFSVFTNAFQEMLKDPELHERGVRVEVLGRWREYFPKKLKDVIDELMLATAQNKKRRLTLLMAYSGVDEMLEAIRGVYEAVKSHPQHPITRQLVKNHLWTRDLPPVDLVIRTGGEPHWSEGLMMWDTANTQLYFTETLWPAFTEREFMSALRAYGARERRFGK